MAVIYATFAVAKRKPEKNSGLYGIRTLDLLSAISVAIDVSRADKGWAVKRAHPSKKV